MTKPVEVLDVRYNEPIAKVACTVRNAAGEDCLIGTATTYSVPLAGL